MRVPDTIANLAPSLVLLDLSRNALERVSGSLANLRTDCVIELGENPQLVLPTKVRSLLGR